MHFYKASVMSRVVTVWFRNVTRDRSEKTIETQMSDIRRKLDVSNSNHAVAEGFRKGLIR